MPSPETIVRLRGLEPHLRSNLRGQDHVLPRLAAGFGRSALSLPSAERPAASFLLAGPTGVGKSEAFTLASDYTFGAGQLATFDMSEYQERSSINKLLGEDRNDPGLLGRVLLARPAGALLFDEIEKAYPLVLDLFLQILWRGCITVATGQTFALGGYVIGFTSNIGAAESMRMEHSSVASIEQATLRRLEQSLRPELLGRLDERLVFARLGPEAQRAICALEVEKETRRLAAQGYDLILSKEAMELLIREGFNARLGARALRKTVEHQLQNAILRDLLAAGSGSGRLVPDPQLPRLHFINSNG